MLLLCRCRRSLSHRRSRRRKQSGIPLHEAGLLPTATLTNVVLIILSRCSILLSFPFLPSQMRLAPAMRTKYDKIRQTRYDTV
jgi:hypothetical protein